MNLKKILHEKFYMLIYNIMLVYCSSQPIIEKKYSELTACEYSVHMKCVMGEASKDTFLKDCNETAVLQCLNDHLLKDICLKSDSDTLATIQALIQQIARRFKRNDKCADENFLLMMRDHFMVLGEVIEHTEQIRELTSDKQDNQDVISGSGEIPDDTENDGDDDDEIHNADKHKNNINTHITKIKSNTTNTYGDKDDIVKYWEEKAKKNLLLREKQKKTILVFFDGSKQIKKNKIKKQNKIPKHVYTAWEKLKREYQKWFSNSRFNLK